MVIDSLRNINKIHFIGVGGIGISAIARMLIMDGRMVSSSDVSANKITNDLKKKGVVIRIGHNVKNLPTDTELVIYTIAIQNNNPELVRARKLKIPTLTYPQALGLLSKDFKTVAISGTHGKTTTTAMVAKICIDAGLSPTVIVGSLLKETSSNFVPGESKLFIVEACEYRESFLNLDPYILAITNIDNDHLDYYKTMANIKRAFKKMARKIPSTGYLVCNMKDKAVRSVIAGLKCRVINYNKEVEEIKLKIPGKHNIENAKTALAIAKILNIAEPKALKSLATFSGTWRRSEYKGKTKTGASVYDDYAHHPTEIKATLSAFRDKFPNKRMIIIFQPHLFSRTKALLKEFAKSLDNTDMVILTPIYAAREKPLKDFSSKNLFDKLKARKIKTLYLKDFKTIKNYLKSKIKASKNDIIITIGAGDIYKLSESLLNEG